MDLADTWVLLVDPLHSSGQSISGSAASTATGEGTGAGSVRMDAPASGTTPEDATSDETERVDRSLLQKVWNTQAVTAPLFVARDHWESNIGTHFLDY